MSQCDQILAALKLGPVTPMDAMREFGVMRLAARILDLKDEGHDIRTEYRTSRNRFGEPVRYAEYSLVEMPAA